MTMFRVELVSNNFLPSPDSDPFSVVSVVLLCASLAPTKCDNIELSD